MADQHRKTPIHLWIVGILALLWNSVGAFDYLATQLRLESYMSQFSPEQLDYFYAFPAWVVAFWAFGVWGAVLGSIALLLRLGLAVWLFAISLVGMIGSSIYNFGLSNGAEIMGQTGVIFSVVIWVIAIALLVYSLKQAKNGVLR